MAKRKRRPHLNVNARETGSVPESDLEATDAIDPDERYEDLTFQMLEEMRHSPRTRRFKRGAPPALETNLLVIAALSKRMEDENIRFRTFLKMTSSDQVDAAFQRILNEVKREIDCSACMNCCIALEACVTEEDVARIAARFDMSPEEFSTRYVVQGDGEDRISGKPCPFLKDMRCSLEDSKPTTCAEFPYLHKEGMVFRLFGVLENSRLCPIVFNVFDRLKHERFTEDDEC